MPSRCTQVRNRYNDHSVPGRVAAPASHHNAAMSSMPTSSASPIRRLVRSGSDPESRATQGGGCRVGDHRPVGRVRITGQVRPLRPQQRPVGPVRNIRAPLGHPSLCNEPAASTPARPGLRLTRPVRESASCARLECRPRGTRTRPPRVLGFHSRRISRGQRQMMDGRGGHARLLVEAAAPDRPDHTVDQHGPFEGSQSGCKQLCVGTEPAAIGVREQDVVVFGKEPNRRRNVGVRPWSVRKVEQFASLLVGEDPQLRPQPVEHLRKPVSLDQAAASAIRAGPNAAR